MSLRMLPFHRKGRFIAASLAVLLAAFFVFLEIGPRPDIVQARQLLADWDLRGAVELLGRLHTADTSNVGIERLYGEALLKRGALREAREVFGHLAARDSALQHRDLIQLGFATFYLGLLDSSEGCAREGIRLARRLNDDGAVAKGLNLLGLVEFNRGRYRQARRYQEQSLNAARAAHSRLQTADALRQLGVLQWYFGHADSARTEYYDPALALYRDIGDKIGEATTLSNIGLLYASSDDRVTGLRYQLEAYHLRTLIGDQRGLADSYYFLTFTDFGMRTGARFYEYRMKSYRLSAAIGYAWGMDVANRALEEYIPAELDHFRKTGQPDSSFGFVSGEQRLFALYRHALMYLDRKEWGPSASTFARVISMCDSLGYVVGRQVFLNQYAMALAGLGRTAEAEHFLHLSLRRTQQASRSIRGVSELLLARVQAHSGKKRQARMLLDPLVRELDSLYLTKLTNPNTEFALEQAVTSVHRIRSQAYGLLTELSLSESTERVFRLLERERVIPFWGEEETQGMGEEDEFDAARLYVDLLDQYESHPEVLADRALLESRIGEIRRASVTRRRALSEAAQHLTIPPIPPLAEVRQLLEPNEVILDYGVGETSVFLLAIRHDRSKLIVLPISPQELASSVQILRELILRGGKNPEDSLWIPPAVKLYRTLISPAEQSGLIHAGDRLLFVPSQSLHVLPFPALVERRDGDSLVFLCENYETAVIPSASWFRSARSRQTSPIRTLLGVAPLAKTLPFSASEVASMRENHALRVSTLFNAEATAGHLLRMLPDYDVVHIATHAHINIFHPLYSFIQCSDDRLELYELFNHSGPSRLIVLSSCESGASYGLLHEDYSSEDIVSFARLFLQNGVPSVIASLWLVEDEATSQIFTQFYSLLGRQTPPPPISSLLTQARRQYLAQARRGTGKAHPFYWAAFSLFGDSR